jgi:hypothetical protein
MRPETPSAADSLPDFHPLRDRIEAALGAAGLTARVTLSWHDWPREAPLGGRGYLLLGTRAGLCRPTIRVTLRPAGGEPRAAQQWYRGLVGREVVEAVLHEHLPCHLAYRLAYAVCLDGRWRDFDPPLIGECRLGETLVLRKETEMKGPSGNGQAAAPVEAPDAVVQETVADAIELFDLSEERDAKKLRTFAQRLQQRVRPVHPPLGVIDEKLVNNHESRLEVLERLYQQLQRAVHLLARGRTLEAPRQGDIYTHAK